jgi:carbon storage regulator
MLVLTRSLNQAIMIGDNIEIVVVSVKGDKVRIGIKAPNSVPVYRAELYAEIKEANVQAADAAPDVLSQAAALMKQKNKPDEQGGSDNGSSR